MPPLRSRTVTHGRNMVGARALMRASGVAGEDIGKPIVAVANSFTEFVPGHVHLREVGQVVSDSVKAAGAVPREFNTIAVDDEPCCYYYHYTIFTAHHRCWVYHCRCI